MRRGEEKEEEENRCRATLHEIIQEGSVQGQQDSSFICKEFKKMLLIDMDGSVDDVHTILGVEEQNDLPPDFKEYIQKERLYWSRIEDPFIGWVFWSQLDNFADLIRHALRKLIFKKELDWHLFQFWAATKTSEGRTLLTTQFQPFALGKTWSSAATNRLCEYRMGMCREYNNSFYADAECGEEQLGLLGRVFLNKLPESTPDVKYYTLKEYPQRDLALRCEIGSSLAVPVFDHSGHTCVGVLEIVSLEESEFEARMYDIFQEFGLLCFDGYEHCKMQYWDKNEALTAAFQELKMVLESVCKIHNLRLALAWVSCHSCNDLLRSQFQLSVLDYSTDKENDWYYELAPFVNVSKVCLLRKGHITGRILPSPNLLYCSDVKQFSIAEFPLVPYARLCKFGGWFTMCLQSNYTGDELYVLEFFLPESDKNYEIILTKLRLILGTMEEYFKTFKLASGQGLGEALSVEVINFQNGQESRSIQIIPASLELLKDGEVMMLPIHGSVDDAHTILGVVEEDYLPPDFKEYIRNERLNWWRVEADLPALCGRPTFGWVFWSQLNYFANVIRHALQKLMRVFEMELNRCLVQFWAPTKTSEGRTLLTTQFQPFALGQTFDTDATNRLCEYRMGMCREYNNKFYADAESGEDQLGLPGRVFLNKLPESTVHVEHYTLKEYPQRDLALRCKIESSWGLPVFEHSSHTCVGVLEIVSVDENDIECLHDKEFLGLVYDIFQEFGLRCFDGYEHSKMQYWDKNEALTAAFQELKIVYESVCTIHKLPLALTWVSCRSCNDLLQCKFQFTVYEDRRLWYDNLFYFVNVSEVCLLKKGQVTGRILPSPNLLYCSDVKQFSIAEFPLVPYARLCKLGGWFTMCLQSSYTRDELYVLEFFLPESNENDENILTKLRLILGTMEEYFKTFKLASGQGLGEVLSVEVIDFQNGQKSRSSQIIPATRFIPSLGLVQDGGVMLQQVQQDQPSMDAINNGMNVVSEAQNDNLPSLDSSQNGKVTTQVDSSNQPSMDASSNGQNVVPAEQRNIFVVSSSKEHERKTQDRKYKKGGPRIDIPKEEILECSLMSRIGAAGKLGVGISTFKRVCRGHGIDRWPPRNIEKIQPSLPSSVENQGQTPQLNFDFPSNQASGTQDRKHKKGGPRIDIPKDEILKCSHMYQEDAAGKLGIGISTFKRVCRGHGIDRWPPRNIEKIQPSLPSSGFQDADTVTIRAKCETDMIKFRLSLSSTLEELQQQVAKRLNLKAGTYRIKYKDEKDELILACDEDLQDCMQSLGNNDIYITLELLNSS